jgi:hypothetical protein
MRYGAYELLADLNPVLRRLFFPDDHFVCIEGLMVIWRIRLTHTD